MMKSFGCSLIWRLLIFLALWVGVIELVPILRADFAESNLVSNQIRIQQLEGSPERSCIILGSSMAARLDPEVVSEVAQIPVIQMGLDGGSAKIGLQILNQGAYAPNYLILEMNGLLLEGGVNEESLLKQTSEPSFRLAKVLPFVRAENRPSAVIYSGLKKFKDQRAAQGSQDDQVGELPVEVTEFNDGDLNDLERRWADEVKSQLKKTGVAGKNLIFVMLPNGERSNEREYLICSKLARDLGASMIDLKGSAEDGEYQFTDGLHLNLSSGKRASRYLGAYLKNLEKQK